MTKYSFECLDKHFGRASYRLSLDSASQVALRIVQDPLKTGYTGYWKLGADLKPITFETLNHDLGALHGVWKNMREIRDSILPSMFRNGYNQNSGYYIYENGIHGRLRELSSGNPPVYIGRKIEGQDGTGTFHACGIWLYVYDMHLINELLYPRYHPGETKSVEDMTEITGMACLDRVYIGRVVLSALSKLVEITVRIEDLY